ncbi:hypothetical protein JZO77_06555 [Enterococcus hulanensis]|uniref:hypothetical protein n=1 Tax=Enterococcus hulanensis TaxID=2559929 RepID=UPI000B734C11|nr:hypothetical protein [Enterococcus hulanensis]MBO0456399.1 hypothetical protein [Enterococcus hulanensis]OTO19725.1 hypothetical protein A5875_001059 [Enterococcus sp. 3H8_DIV0648]
MKEPADKLFCSAGSFFFVCQRRSALFFAKNTTIQRVRGTKYKKTQVTRQLVKI